MPSNARSNTNRMVARARAPIPAGRRDSVTSAQPRIQSSQSSELPAVATRAAELGAPTIVVEGLTREFETGGEVIRAVDGVSFACHARQMIAITGPSGCGKSTLLYLLGSLEKPTAGHILIDGLDVGALAGGDADRFRRTKIGFVFQSFHLVPNLSAVENVMLPMEIVGVPRRLQRERAEDLLRQVGIKEDRYGHRPGKLSGGQQQRIAVARALANDPTVILADEPTGNLDSNNSRRLVNLLRSLAQTGRTVVVVTHERSIARLADLRIDMLDGRIVALDDQRGRRKTTTGATTKAADDE